MRMVYTRESNRAACTVIDNLRSRSSRGRLAFCAFSFQRFGVFRAESDRRQSEEETQTIPIN